MWSLRLEGSEEMDWDWASWDSIEDFKWVKRERMEEVEDSDDEESGFCERLWVRLERRSSIAKCFFCFSSIRRKWIDQSSK